MVNAKRLVSFISFDDAHTNQKLAELIYKELLEYEISDKMLLSLNNASNNNKAIKYLQSYLTL